VGEGVKIPIKHLTHGKKEKQKEKKGEEVK
jgi:hypothetical protein